MMMVQHISFDENRTTLEFFTYIHCVGCNFLRGPPRVTMYTEQGNGTRSETGLQSHHQLTSGEKVTPLPVRDGWVWRRSLNLLDFYYLVFSIYIFYLEKVPAKGRGPTLAEWASYPAVPIIGYCIYCCCCVLTTPPTTTKTTIAAVVTLQLMDSWVTLKEWEVQPQGLR